ncbi:acyl carrier protein [Streptomyces diastaticus]|uniref:acyl carrier protein n=1 Tax=Streptomyces diastaticus TaxID=1956 RepID=UPI00365C1E7C
MSHERSLAILLELSGDILGVELEPSDHFFERGGNSLQVLRLVTAMERDHGMRVELQHLLNSPNFADLATHCTFDLGEAGNS